MKKNETLTWELWTYGLQEIQAEVGMPWFTEMSAPIANDYHMGCAGSDAGGVSHQARPRLSSPLSKHLPLWVIHGNVSMLIAIL